MQLFSHKNVKWRSKVSFHFIWNRKYLHRKYIFFFTNIHLKLNQLSGGFDFSANCVWQPTNGLTQHTRVYICGATWVESFYMTQTTTVAIKWLRMRTSWQTVNAARSIKSARIFYIFLWAYVVLPTHMRACVCVRLA